MSTSIALSTIAIAQSSAAASAAREAQRIACQGFVGTFDAKTATVQAAQQYASCVQLLYPTGGDMPRWVAGFLVFWFLSFIVGGVVYGRRTRASYEDGVGDYVMWALCGLMLGAVVLLALVGVGGGLYYAFGG